MIQTSKDEKAIKELSIQSGISESQISAIFTNLIIKCYLDIKDKEKFTIPYFGEFFIKFREDIITDKGKQAEVDVFITPHDQLKRLVGQIEDEKKSGIIKNDAVDLMLKIAKQDLKTKLI